MDEQLGGQAARRRTWPFLLLAVVVVVVGAAGFVWVSARPSTSTACTLGAAIDEVGGPTAAASRARWAAATEMGVDIEHPDETSGSGDRVTATYVLDGPDRGPADPDRTYYWEVVTERGSDDVWRVTEANTCEEWRGE